MDISDRIEKVVVLRAPVSRVWRAVSDAAEFGRWFGVRLDGAFVAGQPIRGTFEMKIDEERLMARQQAMGLTPSKLRWPAPNAVFGTVERIDPEHYFSFRWIPFGIDAEETWRMTRQVDQEAGLFVGVSSGAALAGAIQVAAELDEGVVVTLLPDDGSKYISLGIFD